MELLDKLCLLFFFFLSVIKMKLETVLAISYILMILRVVFSVLAFFSPVIWMVILISVLDALDGYFVWRKYRPNIPERKQKLDYSVDVISRTILLIPMFSSLPLELYLWFIIFYIWYYVTTIARIITGEPWFVAFTCPLMILFVGVEILQYFDLSYIWLIEFLIIGIGYELWWHKLGPYEH